MIRRFVVTVGTVLLTLGLAAGPALAGPQAGAPGTPGEPNCVGQTNAFLAQASKEQLDAPGLGNLAKTNGLSVKDVQAIVKQFCQA